jgi:predicted alpha/beta superfamily hydrolase
LFIYLNSSAMKNYGYATGKPRSGRRGDVRKLSAQSDIGLVRLTWDMPDSGVTAVEVFGRYEDDSDFEMLAVLPPDQYELALQSEPLSGIFFKVRLRYEDGRASRGKIIRTAALHKNIVADSFNGREMLIYLPDGYYEDDEYYPVLYMMDGQNLFTEKFAFSGSWHADSALEWLIEQELVEKFIIVGIFNDDDRDFEYTPFTDPEEGGGGAAEFAEFLTEELIPWVEDKYRIISDRENRGIMGSSYGGLFSTWTAINYPEMFSFAGAMSPSYWHAEGAILEELAEKPKLPLRFWICQGTEEWSDFTRPAVDILLENGYVYGEDVVYYEVNGADHNEAAWAARLDYPFIFFKGQTAEEVLDLSVDFEIVRDVDFGDEPLFIVNPVAVFDNGMRYSLYREAEYFIDSPAITIDDAGRVYPEEQEDLRVTAIYGELPVTAEISYEELEDELILLYEKQASE